MDFFKSEFRIQVDIDRIRTYIQDKQNPTLK